jgi:hypothetical protein
MNLPCDHDNRRLIAAAEKVNKSRDLIVADYKRRYPSCGWVLSLAADELALAELKESLAKKSRVDDLEPMRAEFLEVG